MQQITDIDHKGRARERMSLIVIDDCAHYLKRITSELEECRFTVHPILYVDELNSMFGDVMSSELEIAEYKAKGMFAGFYADLKQRVLDLQPLADAVLTDYGLSESVRGPDLLSLTKHGALKIPVIIHSAEGGEIVSNAGGNMQVSASELSSMHRVPVVKKGDALLVPYLRHVIEKATVAIG